MTVVLGIDPGSKPGYALANTDRVWPRMQFVSHVGLPVIFATRLGWKPMAERYARVVTEGQDPAAKRHGKADVKEESILTLARTAGRQLERAMLHRQAAGYLYPVKVWKEALMPGCGALPKIVFCNRIEAELIPEERTLLPEGERKLDVLDAIGIIWADYILGSPRRYLVKEAP
jgi:hypothetical protein